ncbi:type II toxin-antitoxin system YhaV family toxin [Salmonella enterica]|uniref:type II toxin-antitoxin system YhaV family toxin n=1 Tax=Salmonella enterica TaxID=28901 RepID=UPI0008FC9496|nr:type II toxin-antitoxin system YhaV family toxin [Salmonella enterica]EAU5132152.1 type II toxin-antitoxin system YhaV family toxin [Salmonella enterica subsp. enterica serovar Oranienburg]EBK2688488.1 type II toxin-antitoxin system YhaV family toxin [Salmonella enterica subsp. enterica serovar Newport]OIV00195.1 toxin YhaV [Salmonella enterica subsp. houtenae]EBA1630099.1 type II toxin-antitoxin system YhaV family toxin [Salmonella enterica]ECB3954710.1 type II toxin-antitoxin system YhaV 
MNNGLPEEINGWKIYVHPCFADVYEALVDEVESLKGKDPDGYKKKAPTKLLAVVHKVIETGIAVDPSSPAYRQGATLGNENKDWSRAKFGNGRYRLFFRYSSDKKVIILAWMNDSNTLRTYGSKSDSYKVFEKMLKKGKPPRDWATLLKESKK